jgi:hypothetical protein
VIDRELVDAFLWPLDRPLTSFAPDPTEVIGLAELAATDLLALLARYVPTISALYLESGADAVQPIEVGLHDLVPVPTYHAAIARQALAYATGGPEAVQPLGDEPVSR